MFSLNVQPNERLFHDSQGFLDVFDVWPTIQGEGPLAGTPAVFVRLAGCNLTCPMCDTDYTSKRERLNPAVLVGRVLDKRTNHHIRLCVITGGEPLRQNILPFVKLAQIHGMDVQIETNGTLYQELPLSTIIVCSPKTDKLHPKIKDRVDTLKYVVAHEKVDPKDGLPTSVLGMDLRAARPWPDYTGDIIVQPLDEQDPIKNDLNMETAINSCMRFGYRLGIQLHKEVGMP